MIINATANSIAAAAADAAAVARMLGGGSARLRFNLRAFNVNGGILVVRPGELRRRQALIGWHE